MKFRIDIISLLFALTAFFSPALFSEETEHTVRKGETVFSIARSFNVDRNELMRVNGITDPNRLLAGQRLVIPEAALPGGADAEQPRAAVSDAGYYQAARGDTFYGIARKFGVSVSGLLEANSLPSDYVLKQGDILAIPGAPLVSADSGERTPEPDVAERLAALKDTVRWPVIARELSYMAGGSGGMIITGERAEPVKSLTSGTVISAGPYRGYGRVAIVQAPDGHIYVYGGCESLTVREGDKVGPGMEMGRLGVDAITEKPQLFFRVYLNNNPVDPAKAPRA